MKRIICFLTTGALAVPFVPNVDNFADMIVYPFEQDFRAIIKQFKVQLEDCRELSETYFEDKAAALAQCHHELLVKTKGKCKKGLEIAKLALWSNEKKKHKRLVRAHKNCIRVTAKLEPADLTGVWVTFIVIASLLLCCGSCCLPCKNKAISITHKI